VIFLKYQVRWSAWYAIVSQFRWFKIQFWIILECGSTVSCSPSHSGCLRSPSLGSFLLLDSLHLLFSLPGIFWNHLSSGTLYFTKISTQIPTYRVLSLVILLCWTHMQIQHMLSTHTHMHTHMHTRTHAYTHAHTRTCTRTYMCTHMHMRTQRTHMHTRTHVHTHSLCLLVPPEYYTFLRLDIVFLPQLEYESLRSGTLIYSLPCP
jgi:hypothetical protein